MVVAVTVAASALPAVTALPVAGRAPLVVAVGITLLARMIVVSVTTIDAIAIARGALMTATET